VDGARNPHDRIIKGSGHPVNQDALLTPEAAGVEGFKASSGTTKARPDRRNRAADMPLEPVQPPRGAGVWLPQWWRQSHRGARACETSDPTMPAFETR
jgi:hypothetical protein